ncbi:hypothetical protein J0X19_20740 [Hymenobacter sp. BT186]|uniref:Uncharacterized protein n=1 Tax=Hymenobacter telluris TaxID=2816474 RepID=A0A939JCP5_9BACT|nr:hypothetical protein [Hymenobacter telluris]MBO0360401.1 hypothetical protein [Hymenobacter telluris]MBW3376428.1 hypothetical protein [Hymenobacter norwichensis]
MSTGTPRRVAVPETPTDLAPLRGAPPEAAPLLPTFGRYAAILLSEPATNNSQLPTDN